MRDINSFPPIVDENSLILILGSIPGVESLRKKEYYGHPRNAFWQIIFNLTGSVPTEDYNEKKQILLENNLALWDVVGSCSRKGSLDLDIRNEEVNDFGSFYSRYPKIKCIFFNGAKAYEIYKRKVGFEEGKSYIKLPSTSPAHAVSFLSKIETWQMITEYKKKLLEEVRYDRTWKDV